MMGMMIHLRHRDRSYRFRQFIFDISGFQIFSLAVGKIARSEIREIPVPYDHAAAERILIKHLPPAGAELRATAGLLQRLLGRPDSAPHGEHQAPRSPGWGFQPRTHGG